MRTQRPPVSVRTSAAAADESEGSRTLVEPQLGDRLLLEKRRDPVFSPPRVRSLDLSLERLARQLLVGLDLCAVASDGRHLAAIVVADWHTTSIAGWLREEGHAHLTVGALEQLGHLVPPDALVVESDREPAPAAVMR